MNPYEYRLKTITEAITILGDKQETRELVEQLRMERTQILDNLRGEQKC